ncbi:MAG: argininosuccinate lyase [Deltaproteobacteria bacterium]|nr:argininosuccinate lyase [Deltaproteobacteria bacterium]
MSDKAWGGRFEEEIDDVAPRFSESVSFDRRLYREDIEGSIAHVRMLANRGIIPAGDAEKIETGLGQVQKEIEDGEFEWDVHKEDVHMNIESRLTANIGDAGGRLHTGRSRNDQVATDMRLWVRRACRKTAEAIEGLVAVLSVRAAGTVDVLMPGYTHLQRAQPVRLAHHLLAWAEMLLRDRGRLEDAARRLNECPLGAGALAATTFPIDRDATAAALGFDRPTRNSLDTVADRDFLVEFVAGLANCAVHLSRIAEELVLWSSQEYGFVRMSDAFTTGSSMMPQKKNPDMAELVRGKTGRVVGDLVTLLVMLKGLPLAYNRGMQEDKPPVFDAFDTVNDSLAVLTGAIATARFGVDAMRAALATGFLDATEVADYLVTKGVPFRDAHHVSGRLVARAVADRKTLSDLPLDVYREEHAAFDDGVYGALDMETAVERRDVPGGPKRARVEAAIAELRERLTGFTVDIETIAKAHGAEERP